MKMLNLAIIGQGRSGKDIHGAFYRSQRNTHYVVKYVVDEDQHRRNVAEEIYPGCTTFADYKELFNCKDIDLVVNATYSEMHYSITKDLLQHGFNVLVEKPLARNRFECDDLIKTAKENNVLLVPFQQTFFAPYYLKAKEIVSSGVLGEIQQIDIVYSGYARRWDWQTLQKRLAGNIYNTGPHPIGLALGFLEFDEATRVVYSKLAKTEMSSGDSDDYAKILLEAPNRPLIDLEINSNDAYPVQNLKILGSKGTLLSSLGDYKLTYIVEGENPDRPVQETFLSDDKGNPLYCGENLVKHEENGALAAGEVFTKAVATVYEEIYYALTENKPITITAEKAREIISVIDRVHSDNPLPMIF